MEAAADDRHRSPSPSINFLSSEFDPVRVLSTSPSKLQLPYPTVQACDNLDAYQSVVQGTRRQWVESVGGAKKEGGGAATTAKIQSKRRIATVLDFMNNPQLETFSLLQRCHGNRERVRVWIRHCAGVRGVCEGVLLAFDKHFNLVLGDVSEQYTPFRTLANGGRSNKRKRKRHSKKKIQTQSNPLLAAETLSSPAEESREEYSTPTSMAFPPVLSDCATTSDQDSVASSTGIAAVSSEQTVGAATEKPGHLTSSVNVNTHFRHAGQFFIRGDNVVLIALAPAVAR